MVYQDATAVMPQSEADDWYFDYLGSLTISLQSVGYGEFSTTVLDSLKMIADAKAEASGEPHLHQAKYYFYVGHFFYKQVDMDQAEPLFKKGLEVCAQLSEKEPKTELQLNNILGLLHSYLNESELALPYYKAAIAIAESNNVELGRRLILYKSMAYLYHAITEYELSDSLYHIVIENIEHVSTRGQKLRTKMDYAVNLAYLGDTAKCFQLLKEVRTDIGDDENINYSFVLAESYTEALTVAGRYKEAAEWLNRSRSYYYEIQEIRRKSEVQEWQAKYQNAEQKATINALEQQQTIGRSRTIIGSLIGLVIIGLLAFFLYAAQNRRKRLAAQLNSERKVNETRSQFFASIAHDIRTPLALMLAPLERLENQVQGEANKADVRLARRNGIRLMDLFNQILDWNKAGAKLLAHNPQLGRVDNAFTTIIERFEQLAVEKGISFKAEVNVTDNLQTLDFGKMDRVVSNLLENAVKYCTPGDQVKLEAELSRTNEVARLVVKVKDDGPGIPGEEQEKIFNRYFQGEAGKIKGGSGIGLALVQELVVIMGGQIKLQSTPGASTVFEVSLPIEKVAASVVSPVSDNAIIEDDEKATLLIVEDEPELLNFMASDLTKRFRVLTADTAATGLEIARQ